MNTQSFFATHPVFTVQEFEQFLKDSGTTPKHNRKRLLGYHRRRGRLFLIRQGLYGVTPPGTDAETYPIDSYLVAAYLTSDAIIAYHSALAYHGVAHSLREDRVIITKHPLTKRFQFRGVSYRTTQPPRALVEKQCEDFGVEPQERQRTAIRVTGLERTLVDCLNRPTLGGDWEEVWRSYEAVPYLDLESVVTYAQLLENATTIASVGYFLQAQRERWMVEEEVLDRLRAHRPQRPHYLGRLREESGRLVKEWNLIVPERILSQTWEETHESVA